MIAPRHALASLAALTLGCPAPTMAPPPMEPTIAAPEAPRIPWLAAGTPDITPPQIPWLTDESACPAGWGWVEVAPGLNGCDPYPTGRIEDCGPTGAHFPGEAGCRDLDSGDADWPSDLPATNVIYVREGASVGDGTRALPFATLPEALAVATEGATIALGPGRYDTGQGGELGPGIFDTLSKIRVAGIHLRGTSVARTTLFSARPAPPAGATGDTAMLVVEAADVEISDLHFESPHPAVDILAGGAATVRRVVLDGTFGGLAAALGGVGVFEDVLARNWFGYPLVYAVVGSPVTLRRAVLQTDSEAVGMFAQGVGGSMSTEDVAVIGPVAPFGASDGGQLDATRVTVVDPGTVAIFATGAGSLVHARWMHVGSLPSTTGGVAAVDGATVELEDVAAVATPADFPIVGSQTGGTITVSRGVFVGRRAFVIEGQASISDVVSRDAAGHIEVRSATANVSLARVEIAGGGGHGVDVSAGATVVATDVSIHDLGVPDAFGFLVGEASLSLERASLERLSLGMYARTAETTLTDVVIRDVSVMNVEWAHGGLISNGSTLVARRVAIEHVEGAGFSAFMPNASLQLEDVVVRDFRGAPGRSWGLLIDRGVAASSVVRAEVQNGLGVGVLTGSDVHLEDLLIEGIQTDADGIRGVGLLVGARRDETPSAHVTGSRIVIRDTALAGLWARTTTVGLPARASVTLTDVRIERTGSATQGGAGVFARGDADVSLSRFVVRDAASAGVMATMGAQLTLMDGLVTATPSCTSSESPLDLTTVVADMCGDAPVTWTPPEL